MGSRTYESIAPKFRPLANRTNIVLSRNPEKAFDGVEMVATLGEAIALASSKPGAEEIMIVGGGSVYEQAMPLTQRIYLTQVDTIVEDADTFYPELDDIRWTCKEVGRFEQNEKNQYSGTYYVYERTGNYPIVEPSSGRNEAYRNQLQGILDEGVCPFCPGGETLRDQQIIKTTKYWFVKFNQHPLPNTAYHFMLTPLRHFTASEDITAEEWLDLCDIRRWLKSEYAMTGDAIYARSGELLVTGATVSHYHAHIIVPAGPVSVVFGAFPKQQEK
jgi:dihydrofolate reductase